MARRSYDPNAYNPDIYEAGRDDRPTVPIDVDGFNAEQDHIAQIMAQVEAEYTRVNGPSIFAEVAAYCDRYCPVCRGKGFIGSPGEMVQCDQCMGTGAESFVITRQERAA